MTTKAEKLGFDISAIAGRIILFCTLTAGVGGFLLGVWKVFCILGSTEWQTIDAAERVAREQQVEYRALHADVLQRVEAVEQRNVKDHDELKQGQRDTLKVLLRMERGPK
jgi:hypothetical protein